MKYEYYDTRAWGQFWPDTLFLGISSCFMLVQILLVTLSHLQGWGSGSGDLTGKI